MSDATRTIRFYHITGEGSSGAETEVTSPAAVDAVLARLLDIAATRGQPALVVCATASRAGRLDDALWSYADDSFLPHLNVQPEHVDNQSLLARQPVLLASQDEHATEQLLSLATGRLPVVLAGAEPALTLPFVAERLFYLFPAAPAAVATARAQWKSLKAAGHTLEYWQETGGKWVRKQ